MSMQQAHMLALRNGVVFKTVADLLRYYVLLTHDPHDDCSDWIGKMPYVDHCGNCGCTFRRHAPDKHDPTKCFYCAHKWREENDKSECCNADLFAQEVGFETEYGDHYVCQACGDVTCKGH